MQNVHSLIIREKNLGNEGKESTSQSSLFTHWTMQKIPQSSTNEKQPDFGDK